MDQLFVTKGLHVAKKENDKFAKSVSVSWPSNVDDFTQTKTAKDQQQPPQKKLPQVGGGKSSGKIIQHYFGDLISVYIISPLQMKPHELQFHRHLRYFWRRPRSQGANLPPMALRQRLPSLTRGSGSLEAETIFWRGTRMILERLGCCILWHQVFQIFNIGDVKRMQERVTRVYPRS